jgi:site-specific recombinase XerD
MVLFKEFLGDKLNLQTKDAIREKLRGRFETFFTIEHSILKQFSEEILNETETKKTAKIFYLSKQKSKKAGYVYIVRYRNNEGEIIKSHWSTGTGIYGKALDFAINNREKILQDYYAKNEGDSLYKILAEYYSENGNEAYNLDVKRGDRKSLCERNRKQYYSFINNVFIPYMKNEQGKRSLADIETTDIRALQDKLLSDGIKGQSINKKLSGVKMVFNHLIGNGKIKNMPFTGKMNLAGKVLDTGVYELEELKNVFQKPWNDDLSYILNLIIHTCGLRNDEISNLLVSDITNNLNGTIFNNHFLKVCSTIEGKNKDAKRTVPLPPFVYKKIQEYILKMNRGENDYIFDNLNVKDFDKATILLGSLLGYSEIELDKDHKNIRFYSGRHFYKTMLNCGSLGEDIEEFFMGHRVTNDIKQRYNHKDKIGKENLVKKIELMFTIIDKTLFS